MTSAPGRRMGHGVWLALLVGVLWTQVGLGDQEEPAAASASADAGAGASAEEAAGIEDKLAAAFTAEVVDLELSFTDRSTGKPTSWSWEFGDGQVSTEQNPRHPYGQPGEFSVKLTVANADGADSATKKVTAFPPDRYTTYQLSYVESERALALLTTLGYPVIDLAGGGNFPGPKGPLRKVPRPIVYRLPDSEDISVAGGASFGKNNFESVTTGVPQQRLLIAWTESTELQKLLNRLHEHIDVAAKQILVEVLVIELDRDRFRDLGFSYEASKDGSNASFQEAGGVGLPLLYDYTRPAAKTIFEFAATVKALAESGEAEVLSRPSVLVLDGRQARIDVEDKFPYSTVVRPQFETEGKGDEAVRKLSRTNLIQTSAYFGVGITLNLRVRASEDDTDVTMRVETRINSRAGSGKQQSTQSGALIGPPLVKREINTFVRVANNTPLIIGGLIRSTSDVTKSGIPYLSKIPILGGLFRRTNKSATRKEVIIVLTPHIIPADDDSLTFTIARDSELFDRSGLELFRSVYRVRSDDLFDLDFIEQSEFMESLSRWVLAFAEKAFKKLVTDKGLTPVPEGDRLALARKLREVRQQDREVLREIQEKEIVLPSLKRLAPKRLAEIRAIETTTNAGARRGKLREVLEEEIEAQRRDNKSHAEVPEDGRKRLLLLEGLHQAVLEIASSRPAEAFLQLLEGKIPGEDKFVKRMLLQIVEERGFDRFVKLDQILFYERQPGSLLDASRPVLKTEPLYPRMRDLDPKACRMLQLTYPSRATSQGLPFDPPSADVSEKALPTEEEFRSHLRELNRPGPGGYGWESLGILLSEARDCYETRGRSTLEHLRSVLVLKRLLDLNPGLPLTLDGLHVGRDLILPEEADLTARYHVVDRETATLFYETLDYYFAFEQSIRQVVMGIDTIIRSGKEEDAEAAG